LAADPLVDHPSLGGIPLVLGGNVFGWTIDRDQSFSVLDAFHELGGRMIDTAEGYSRWVPGNRGGESETIIGAWMESRGVRAEMRVATKTGMGGQPDALRPDTVARALEASLERLRTDYVDLYYAHRDDGVTPLDEVVEAYDTAFRSGRARELGASNYNAERLKAVTATADRLGARPFTVLQPLYNLVSRDSYEGPLQDLCVARNIAVTPYSGLASGFLSGKYQSAADWEGANRASAVEHAAANGGWEVLATVRQIAREIGRTPAQVALAWLNAQPGVAAPIASATTREQVIDVVGIASLSLSEDHIHALNDSR
jgi:aryl-alcohol dehydrogenase-like predicted oxidoreductase